MTFPNQFLPIERNLVQELFSIQTVKYSMREILKSTRRSLSVAIISYLQLYPGYQKVKYLHTCISLSRIVIPLN